MPETSIVVICWNGHEGDFELPARLPLKTWEQALFQAVRMQFSILHGKRGKMQLFKDRVQIRPEWTLEQCGIYDGSVLQLQLIED